MSNKKLSRLLEPNLKFYFFFMALFVVAAATVNPWLAIGEAVVTAILYVNFSRKNKKRRQGILQYIDNVTGSVDTASKSTLINSPLPIMVFRPDTGEIIWSNENFLQLAGVRDHLFEMKLEEARYLHALHQQEAQKAEFPNLSAEAVAEAYPGRCQSLTQVLSTADARLNKLSHQ